MRDSGLGGSGSEELYAQYLDPPWTPPARRERAFLDSGEPLGLATEFGPVLGRRWRAEGERRGQTLLAHGWAGRVATWLVLAPLLTGRGFDVIAYDAPAHGETRGASDGGGEPGRSHFFAFAATLVEAGRAHGGFAGAVGHSFGGSVLPFALNHGLEAERAALIAPTAETSAYLSRWAAAQGLAPEEEAGVGALWAAEFGPERLEEVGTLGQAARMTIPAMVMHDEGDGEVPSDDGAAVAAAWPGAEFVRTTGLAHRRILLSREAMGRVADFIAGDPAPSL